MKTKLDKLRPGDLFRTDWEYDDVTLLCLWQHSYMQLATPDDDRVLVNFGFTRVGQAFIIETYEWHDCNTVKVL